MSINSRVHNGGAVIDRLHGVLVFLSVVETRSFSETARTLGVSTSAVSAAVLRLEQKLSVRLLNRTTRQVRATPEGFEFYRRCKQIISDLEEAENNVSRFGRMPSGKLRIGIPSALGRMWVIPRLPTFTSAYPAVNLEIVIGDFLAGSNREALDACIQVGELKPSRQMVRKLASVDYVVCASPDYIGRRGTPKTPSDLGSHDCICYRRPRNGQIRQWRLARGKSTELHSVKGVLTFNSGEALISAAAAGFGLIQVAEYYAQPCLSSGELVEVLADYKVAAYDISVVFQRGKRTTPRLRAFIDFLVDLFVVPPWTAPNSVPRKRRFSDGVVTYPRRRRAVGLGEHE